MPRAKAAKTSRAQLQRWQTEQQKKRNEIQYVIDELEPMIAQFLNKSLEDAESLDDTQSIEIETLKSLLLTSINRLNTVDDYLVRDFDDEELLEAEPQIRQWHITGQKTLNSIEYVLKKNKAKMDSKTQMPMQQPPQAEGEGESDFVKMNKLNQEMLKGFMAVQYQQNQQNSNIFKMPKLSIEPFYGDNILKWQPFWDSFFTSVHQNKSLANITKFEFLRGCLRGDALRLLDGIDISDTNYAVAVEYLKNNYGDTDLIISTHIHKLTAIQPVVANNTDQLKRFLETAEAHIRCLVSLEAIPREDSQKGNRVLVEQLLAKLPNGLCKKLVNTMKEIDGYTLKSLFDELRKEVLNARRSEAHQTLAQENQPKSKGYGRPWQPKGTASALTARSQPSCVYCNANHWSDQCTKCKMVADRITFLNQNNRCRKCLQEGHKFSDCKSSVVCYYCKKSNHHRSICYQQFSGRDKPKWKVNTTAAAICSDAKPSEQGNRELPTNVANVGVLPVTQDTGTEEVLLCTAVTTIKNPLTGKLMQGRLLIDSGSQCTVIKRRLSENLQLKPIDQRIMSVAGFAQEKPIKANLEFVEFGIKLQNGSYMMIKAAVNDIITHDIRKVPVDSEKFPVLDCVTLAEPLSDKVCNVTVDILLGAKYCWKILLPQKNRELQDGLYLVGSKLGYMISGELFHEHPDSDSVTTMSTLTIAPVVTPHVYTEEPELQMETFWGLDQMGIKDCPYTKDDDIAQEIFNANVQFNEKTQRYQVTLLWKDRSLPLHDNFELSLKRLKWFVPKLRESGRIERYDQIFRKQLELGVIEICTEKVVIGDKVFYIPHHCVIRLEAISTKERVVFDASSKARDAPFSLNEMLYPGPVGLEDLCGLLMRFRKSPIAIVSDIEKAFLQIEIAPHDRDACRLIWLKDINKPVTSDNLLIMRFARVGFGIVCSPFLLMAVIRHHMLQPQIDCPLAREIAKNIYVDNLILGREDLESAMELYRKSKELFGKASMNLRQFNSNCKEFNNSLPEADKANEPQCKVLGLGWDTATDTIYVRNPRITELVVETKRQLVSTVSKPFDPLGLFSPLNAEAKLLLQRTWKLKMKWDDKLSREILDRWEKLKVKLQDIHKCKIPRMVGPVISDSEQLLTLHCFTDASMKVFAAVVYLRIQTQNYVKTFLLFGKNRLAPTKGITLPRLELLGVVLGARVLTFVETELRCKIRAQYLWTDSECVLAWLKTYRILPTFVQNRVNKLKTYDKIEFNYVDTNSNPADIPTKPEKYSGFEQNEFWWNGPKFLLEGKEKWPQSKNFTAEELRVFEPKSAKTEILMTILAMTQVEHTPPMGININKFSKLEKLIRSTAVIRRTFVIWKEKAQGKKNIEKTVTNDDMNWAFLQWETWVQNIEFEQTKLILQKGGSDNRSQQLGLFLDEQGLLRCKGRIKHADLPDATKFPKLLPKMNKFTELVIERCHRKLTHAGTNRTLAQVRLEYWVPQGRKRVTQILKKCQLCRLHQGGTFASPPIPPLPEFRLKCSYPFANSGVDYVGPLFTKENEKIWVCLFTCAVTRAVHLEIVLDLTAAEFLNALKRFIARRGQPMRLVSDNATYFKLADISLQVLRKNSKLPESVVQSYIADQGINWVRIVEMAPWFGAFYERLIQTVKRGLKKTVGRKSLTLNQLQTLIVEIEAIVNARPLAPMSEDVAELCLTPAHLLLTNPKIGLPQIENETDPDYTPKIDKTNELRKQWREGQKAINYFWSVWRNDYLLSLREQNWKHVTRNTVNQIPKVGAIVLIKDVTPRAFWKRAKIVELIKGNDGHYRAVYLKLPNAKITRRPVKLLVPLEIADSDEQECYRKEKIPKESEQCTKENNLHTGNAESAYKSDTQAAAHSVCCGVVTASLQVMSVASTTKPETVISRLEKLKGLLSSNEVDRFGKLGAIGLALSQPDVRRISKDMIDQTQVDVPLIKVRDQAKSDADTSLYFLASELAHEWKKAIAPEEKKEPAPKRLLDDDDDNGDEWVIKRSRGWGGRGYGGRGYGRRGDGYGCRGDSYGRGGGSYGRGGKGYGGRGGNHYWRREDFAP